MILIKSSIRRVNSSISAITWPKMTASTFVSATAVLFLVWFFSPLSTFSTLVRNSLTSTGDPSSFIYIIFAVNLRTTPLQPVYFPDTTTMASPGVISSTRLISVLWYTAILLKVSPLSENPLSPVLPYAQGTSDQRHAYIHIFSHSYNQQSISRIVVRRGWLHKLYGTHPARKGLRTYSSPITHWAG